LEAKSRFQRYLPGFNFILAANEFATINLRTSQSQPTGGFYLRQTDPASAEDLLGTGLIGVVRRVSARRIRKQTTD